MSEDIYSFKKLVAFDWVPDPEFQGEPMACPACGGRTKPMRCEPDRNEAYLTHIALCVTEGCRRAWPYLGARALRKLGERKEAA